MFPASVRYGGGETGVVGQPPVSFALPHALEGGRAAVEGIYCIYIYIYIYIYKHAYREITVNGSNLHGYNHKLHMHSAG